MYESGALLEGYSIAGISLNKNVSSTYLKATVNIRGMVT
jgi:hypothetical protein